jgi:LysR family transcriptional regulator (chromosome initiation inhibitor)
MRYLPVAAPAFAGRWLGAGSDAPLEELIVDAPVVFFDRRDEFQDAFVRGLTGGRPASARRHYVPTSEGFVDAVATGMG